MLIAFHEEYLLLIRTCALFCILVMLFNLYDYLSRKRRHNNHQKRTRRIADILESYDQAGEAEQKKQRRALTRMLYRPVGILGLQAALDELKWESSDQIPPKAKELLGDLLIKVFFVYRASEDYVRSLLIDVIIRCGIASDRLNGWLLEYAESNNLLLKTEALRCICIQRNPEMIVRALERISRKPLFFSNKLITDTLMTFHGDNALLLEKLWAALDSFSPEIQVSVLQLLASKDDGSYAGKLLRLLESEKTDMEVRLAAIKYFSGVNAPECVAQLAELLTSETWEYAAVAAKVLENYDCSSVFDALKAGVCSKNWYVRNNCARTIVNSCSSAQAREALEVSDRYGRNSVRYALEIKEKEAVAL